MVCNVDRFPWPPESPVEESGFHRPRVGVPHPETPYVVVLLKMLRTLDNEIEQTDDES